MTLLLFAIFLAACFAAGSTGALFAPGDWYRDLRKPTWTPPGWMFSVVWTVLYLLMSWAAARVAVSEGGGLALALWALQIALNTLWTPVFFGLHRARVGMVIIILLWVSVAATSVAFYLVDSLAGVLMVPYIAWVSVAACLNYSILRLNPELSAANPAP
ncbi:tryptophan-rich sensory protein TspO [Aliiruegeria sabulilitoris]|uniref:tryptophan-rich sensory protein TspO n=1 Tax=Aliiruegeria sabulilitoris TaxID=1510458 RepID=UPI000835A1BB|nr:TspO/MBR family protein [Aliiruegeria sabulilitoris]NDR57154.1 tryptophan-rich sensory protein [Pseudoruegeria sp. M32A2M]